MLTLETGFRGGSRTAATSKMELFVIIVNGFQSLTIITKSFSLDVAAVLDPPLGLSDFQKITVAALNQNFRIRNQKSFLIETTSTSIKIILKKKLKTRLLLPYITQKISPKDFLTFKNIVLEPLNLHAPLKTKCLRANHSSFISRDLSKAIMYRSKLRNQFLKLQTHESRLRYNKQRNLFEILLRKAKRKYYTDLKMFDINGNEKFWKNVKPIFGNRNKGNKTIALEEGNKVITDDENLLKLLRNIL